MSTDGTRQEIAKFQQEHPALRVKVIDNPKRIIPSGLNRAIEAAEGEYIIRVDAHSTPYPDYIANCISALEGGLGDNVGGVWEIRPSRQTWIARAIASAAAHPLAVGDARYRYTDHAQLADTIPFGAFRRSLIERVGMFDETLEANEDYEFNLRVRLAGGKIWLDPRIRSVYFARPTLKSLARQYGRYGYWKAQMLRRYPKSIRWRQMLPPLFVLSLLILGILSLWLTSARFLLGFEISAYLLILLGTGIVDGLKRHSVSLALGLPLAIATMHFAWGTANLWGYIRTLRPV